MSVDLAIIGCVSSGKSTFSNMLTGSRLSDMKIARTTVRSQVYHMDLDSGESDSTIKKIHDANQAENKRLMEESLTRGLKIEDIKAAVYHIPRGQNIFGLRDGMHLAIHDLPGVNDSKTSTLYEEFVKVNFCNYSVVVFVVSIQSAMNTSDEVRILNLILGGIVQNRSCGIVTKLLVVINKCDEMQAESGAKCELIDDELKDMEAQAKKIITAAVNTYKCTDAMIGFVKLSAEDSYIYKMCCVKRPDLLDKKHQDKIGINLLGKTEWVKKNQAAKSEYIAGLCNNEPEINRLLSCSGYHDLVKHLKFNGDEQILIEFNAWAKQPAISDFEQMRKRIEDLSDVRKETKIHLRQLFNKRYTDEIVEPAKRIAAVSSSTVIADITMYGKSRKARNKYSDALKRLFDVRSSEADPILLGITSQLSVYNTKEIQNLNCGVADFKVILGRMRRESDMKQFDIDVGILTKLHAYVNFTETDIVGILKSFYDAKFSSDYKAMVFDNIAGLWTRKLIQYVTTDVYLYIMAAEYHFNSIPGETSRLRLGLRLRYLKDFIAMLKMLAAARAAVLMPSFVEYSKYMEESSDHIALLKHFTEL